MKLTKTSLLTGAIHTLEIDVTDEQLARWKSGVNIQDACGHLTPEEREFIMTGITPNEWDLHMTSEDEEDEVSAEV